MNELPWRERCFEDFEVGDLCRHGASRTVTAYDSFLFTALTQNPAPLHLDDHYARAIGFERIPLNSTLTLSLVTGQSVADLTPNVMTNLGWGDIRLPNPVYDGDTIYSESQVTTLRPSASRGHVGVMSIRTLGYQHEGIVVIELTRTMMVYRRGHVPRYERPLPRPGLNTRQ